MNARKWYRIERIGRRHILQVFTARPEDAPLCVFWERVQARHLPAIRREMTRRGIEVLP